MASKIHVLVVEDDPDYVSHILEVLQALNATIEVDVATSREEAITRIESGKFYDLLNLDLTLPFSRGNPDKNVEYGAEVFHASKKIALGLPILILTGSSTDALVSDFLRSADQSDIWGTGVKRPTVDYVQKMDADRYASEVKEVIEAIQALNDVEIKRLQHNLYLDIQDDRLIRIFCRIHGAVRCDVLRISGGLSDAEVYKITTYNASGNIIHNVIAKIASHEIIQEEHDNFSAFIQRLREDVTPRHIDTLAFGAMDKAAVFYGFADDYETDFFGLCENPEIDESLKDYIKNMTDRWNVSANEQTVSIKDIRRLLLKDEDAQRIIDENNLDWALGFEDKKIQAKWGCIHGDLHGKNILINSKDNRSSLIDYGDVKEGVTCIDPITLEFSLFFHPQRVISGDWPASNQAKHWNNLDDYLVDCPIPEIIKYLRGWTNDLSIRNRDIAAAAYSYILRQLKYEDANKELALNLLEGAKNLYEQT